MTYRDRFPDRAVFPVIHIFSADQVLENLHIAADHNADGVFLIDHKSPSPDPLKQLLQRIRQEDWFERLWIGANFLGMPNLTAFANSYGLKLNGIWTDNARPLHPEAAGDDRHRQSHNSEAKAYNYPVSLYFGSVAFKGQHQHEDDAAEAAAAVPFVDVVTTSGPETGRPATIDKLSRLRHAIGGHPLAVASGVTPENVDAQLPYVDAFLVATGISLKDSFYHIDPDRLDRLVDRVHSYQPPQ